ncbi:response regulator [Ramlibacter humi]|uniref:Response regulator transcription factor n=1 Tax=Ramlibacter humi TaxID=2530451 RepID=A0A4Z0CDF6_9BURK|nr:response regulator transcription factor [Ramlibacter humi]TFZ08490.1 response regulator transcription factor [Ramlibacter humi]
MKTNGSGPVRVVLADDHDLVRSGIKALLGMIDGVEVIAEARDGQELIRLVDSLKPDIVMTDISMPHMDGIAAIAEIRMRQPQVRMLVLSMYDTVDFVKRAVASGACGYLMKDAPPFELEQSIRSVMATGTYFSPVIAQRLLQPSEPSASDELTDRQLEILKLIAQGKASKEIAFDLGLSPKTVDVHRARIMERLKLNDIASLTRYAVRKGLVKP